MSNHSESHYIFLGINDTYTFYPFRKYTLSANLQNYGCSPKVTTKQYAEASVARRGKYWNIR